jgi:hypothetical protein
MSSNPAPAKRVNWFDDKTQAPVIDQYARKMTTFLEVLADGKVDDLMKEIEPKLDDTLHAKVTSLLCELTAYDLMQTFYQMQQARPRTKFRG